MGGLGTERPTWWEGLLELIGLLGILEDKGVKVTLAADLELDGGGLLAALDASRAGVLAAADLDEVLDVGDFSWHFGGSEGVLVCAGMYKCAVEWVVHDGLCNALKWPSSNCPFNSSTPDSSHLPFSQLA